MSSSIWAGIVRACGRRMASAFIAGASLFVPAVQAQTPQAQAEAKAAWDDASKAAVHGPHDITLAGQATLHLADGKVFIPQPQAARLLRAMGNPGTYSNLEGLVMPKGEEDWMAIVKFEKSGYIKDDDAKNWDAADLLKSYREGTDNANKEREKMGVSALEIVGWAEPPRYTAGNHQLVWAMSTKEKGAPADQPQGVNYNTYALGREGYVSLNLVTGLKDLAKDKLQAQGLLSALAFDTGKRYEDFNPDTDHVAEYGLAALVLGVGAKKLGLLAVIGAFLAKFAKLILVGALGLGGAFMKLFRRDKSGG
ncbi:DUF2167 domain-containing protein [Roseateles depolymerans]|uniref:Putative membrane-anchored protein n=1 Tax=Roseateles depolymerans TaxID=76731 RepID=A0A0U3C863_9BURK|nr:DUF2167 domain-containing protein [Roseateles depolymerans]ALV04968.1 Putative membrane-anchored protein [Roseateles depolymerans]REG15020.1 putative membrane-anchored protein [Roseateles depolymerans]